MNNEQFVRQVEYSGWLIDLFHDSRNGKWAAQIDKESPMIPLCEIYPFDTLGDALLAAMINVDFFQLEDWSERSVYEYAHEWMGGHEAGRDDDYRELDY